MLFEAILGLVYILLDCIMALLDVLPQFPTSLVNSINSYLSLVFDNLSLLSFFVRIDTIKIIIPLFLVAYNFEYVYRFVMWIVRKIPLSIE